MKLLIALLVVGSICAAPQPGYYGNQFDLFDSNEFSSEEFGVHKNEQFLPHFETQGQSYEDHNNFIPNFYPSSNQDVSFLNNYQPPNDFQFSQSYSSQQFPQLIKGDIDFPYYVSPKFSGIIFSKNGSLLKNMTSTVSPKNVTVTTVKSMIDMTMNITTPVTTKMPPMNTTVSVAPSMTTVKSIPNNVNNGPFLFFKKFLSLFVGVPNEPVAIQMVNVTKRII